MAVTRTSVVAIQLLDSAGNKRTYNIDNPKTNLTLGEIKMALEPLMAKGFWLSDTYNPYISVAQASINEAIKTQLEGGSAIITPSTITSTITGTIQTITVTVSNAIVSLATITDLSSSNEQVTDIESVIDFGMPKISSTTEGSTVTFTAKTIASTLNGHIVYGKLNLVMYGEIVQVPIQSNVTA